MSKRNLSKQTLLAGATLAALCLMTTFPPHARAAGQDGMVVVRDPQTGQLRAPTAAELKALRARAPATDPALAATPRATTLATRPDGARGVRLGDKTIVYDVVTRGPDGKLSSQCVQGADAAARALVPPGVSSAQPQAGQAGVHADSHIAPGETIHERR